MRELHWTAKTEQKLALGGWHSANALALLLKIQAKNPTPYLEIADISNIKQDNPCNNQALFLNMYQIY